MTEQGTGLQERLGSANNLVARPFDKHSKNTKFLLCEGEKPCFFVKFYNPHESNTGIIKERERIAAFFFHESGILNTPRPVLFQENYAISEYVGELVDTPVEDALEQIAEYHRKALQFRDYSRFAESPLFHNDRREKCMGRLQRHKDSIANLWADIEAIEKKLGEFPQSIYAQFPRILVHGDLHKGNIQSSKSNGKVYIIDFERTYYDSPTWDMARALTDGTPEKMGDTIERYISLLGDTAFVKEHGDEIKRAIYGDCLYRIVTDTIADQQSKHFEDIAKIHLERHRGFVDKIICS